VGAAAVSAVATGAATAVAAGASTANAAVEKTTPAINTDIFSLTLCICIPSIEDTFQAALLFEKAGQFSDRKPGLAFMLIALRISGAKDAT
jgi:hypothetical protein